MPHLDVVRNEKSVPDLTKVNQYMSLTFALRRKEVTQDLALVGDVMETRSALFTPSQVHGSLSVAYNCLCCSMNILGEGGDDWSGI